MKALAAVLFFSSCVAGSIYCYRESIGSGSTLLAMVAAISLFLVWDAIEDNE